MCAIVIRLENACCAVVIPLIAHIATAVAVGIDVCVGVMQFRNTFRMGHTVEHQRTAVINLCKPIVTITICRHIVSNNLAAFAFCSQDAYIRTVGEGQESTVLSR